MKKIVLIFMFLINLLVFSNNERIFSQKELLEKLNFKIALEYEKYKEVYARKAINSEEILTYTKDGLETKNIAKDGDYIVKNDTEAKEMYILTEKKFNSRYELKEKIDDIWSKYKPLGKVRAINVDNELFKILGLDNNINEFYILAAWGEKMVVKKDDFLVAPLDYSETYRIARKEFFETYKEVK